MFCGSFSLLFRRLRSLIKLYWWLWRSCFSSWNG